MMAKGYGGIKLLAMDFDGVLTDNSVYVSEDGKESVRCTRADGIGLQKLREKGIAVIVISTEPNPVVSQRCRKLKLPCYQDVSDKADFLRKHAKEGGIDLKGTAFVGNDENDVGVMKLVGFPMAVADAYPAAKEAAVYVSKKSGGCGAVREICDMIAKDL